MVILQDPAGDNAPRSALFRHESGELADEIELALRLGQIEIRFQPQFACSDRRATGAEALARWLHPLYGPIGARDLFSLAAKAGLADDLPRRLLSLAIVQTKPWLPNFAISFNVAPRQLLGAGFVERFAEELAASALNPRHVTIEITEDLLLDDLERAGRRLNRLREKGVRIALDDFGAGFCNFDYLKRLPLDVLKLDRSMVKGIAENPRDLAVLRAIVALAQALELDVIAEGIETEAQRDVIEAEGCTSWQGFLGAEPLTRKELLQWVASG